MAITKDIVGKKLDRFDFTVERGKIKEFCLAINEKNPIYFDVEEAKKAGYSDVPAPPTFPTVIMFWGYPKIWNDMAELGIDLSKILHLKEEYTYHKILYPGKVYAQSEISDVKVGRAEIVTFKTTIYDEKNDPILSAEMAIFIRKD
ncbi:MaoC family dehydratase [Leptospira biflexa]|nr:MULTISPECIES: MaoC family dehydratase N-terminal domain-containing protein [Leptospira]PKA26055.1 MaoC family dehydratase [Leptospira sp. mixed culture ATI2-C-A1]EMJ88980.1 dehydratase MaoC metal-binding domain protein [Leptospira meyeri serovar Semaranga str. Veldrot Semarang 173]MCG6140325.1 MaoC family dehydratase N-terminal domain-containing protein [Leptospira mtsangambouensis]MCW7479807.1 MaoC family dehydratase N-terminal domain-containing protein [Leptospira kanakyensis]MCW7488085.1